LKPGDSVTTYLVLSYPPDVVTFTVENISFSGAYSGWFKVKTPIPYRFSSFSTSTEERGVVKIAVEVSVPPNQEHGLYSVPYTVLVTTPSGAPLVFNNYVNLDVQPAPAQGSGTLVLILALIFAAAFTIPIVLRNRGEL